MSGLTCAFHAKLHVHLLTGSNSATNIYPSAQGLIVPVGAYLGICASLLWTAQGALMLSFPGRTARPVHLHLWGILNMSVVVTSAMTAGDEVTRTDAHVEMASQEAYLPVIVHPTSIALGNRTAHICLRTNTLNTLTQHLSTFAHRLKTG